MKQAASSPVVAGLIGIALVLALGAVLPRWLQFLTTRDGIDPRRQASIDGG